MAHDMPIIIDVEFNRRKHREREWNHPQFLNGTVLKDHIADAIEFVLTLFLLLRNQCAELQLQKLSLVTLCFW